MSKGLSLSPINDIFTNCNYSTLGLYTSKYKVFTMTKVKEPQYPDECARCRADACSVCGYKKKRADAIDKYYKQIQPTIDKLNHGDKYDFYFKGFKGNLYAEITNITKDTITVEDEDNKVYSIRIKNIISIREVF